MRICGIYLVRHTDTGRGYVGQSIDIEKRMNGHAGAKERGHIAYAVAKYGWQAFTTEVLETCEREQLNAAETKWIAQLGTLEPAGFNLTTGGGQAFTFSEGTRQKISERTKQGQTAEVRARMSASKRGVPKSKEWCAKMSERQKQPDNVARLKAMAKDQTPERRAKLSASRTGMKFSAETCEKISKGKKAQFAAQRAAGIDLSRAPFTKETCAKLSAVQKARHAKDAAADPVAYKARQSAAAKAHWDRVRALKAAEQASLL